MKLPHLLLACAAASFAAGLKADERSGTLDVYWIDSEGGGSTLLVTPANQSVLIDTGNPGGRDPRRIIEAVHAAGLNRIDFLLLTHYHIDHFGGAAEVAAEVPIGVIYERGVPAGDPDGRVPSTFPLQIKPWREIKAPREKLAPGVVIPLRNRAGAPSLELRCLAADQGIVPATPAQERTKNPLVGGKAPMDIPASDNDNSAVFLLSYGAFRFFDGGDLTWDYEAKLVTPYNRVGPVDVYQTDHHGLARSNNPVLIQSLAPTVTVMNNGPHKGGERGAFAALQSASSIQARYQVHKSVDVPAELNTSDKFIANLVDAKPADQCTANRIEMRVAPDGQHYTIAIPANGQTATYATRR